MRVRAVLRCAAASVLIAARAAAVTGPIDVANKVEPPRSQSLGGASVAVGSDSSLVWTNPASGAVQAGPTLTLAGQRGYFGDVTGGALFATPLKSGVIFGGVLYYNEGVTQAFRPDDTLVKATVQQDLLGAAGYAMNLTSKVTMGALLKTLQSRIADNVAATAVAGDLGIQVRLAPMLKMGAALQNVGTGLRFQDEAMGLPSMARCGLAAGWQFASPGSDDGSRDAVIVATDGEYRIADQGSVWHAGLEYTWRKLLAVRAGTQLAQKREPSVIAAGIGIMVRGLRVDYSVRLTGSYDAPQSLSMTFKFLPPPKSGR